MTLQTAEIISILLFPVWQSHHPLHPCQTISQPRQLVSGAWVYFTPKKSHAWDKDVFFIYLWNFGFFLSETAFREILKMLSYLSKHSVTSLYIIRNTEEGWIRMIYYSASYFLFNSYIQWYKLYVNFWYKSVWDKSYYPYFTDRKTKRKAQSGKWFSCAYRVCY